MPSTGEHRAFRVEHGPFPVPVLRLLLGVATMLFAVACVYVTFERDEVRCSRDQGVCVRTFGLPGFRERRVVAIDAIVRVRVDEENTRGAKGGVVRWGTPRLELANGTEVRILRVAQDDARLFARALNTGISDQRRTFAASVSRDGTGALVGLVVFWFGYALVYTALRGAGRFSLYPREPHTLVVERRVLGARLGTRTVSLEGVIDVRVERVEAKASPRDRGSPPEPLSRIVLVCADGAARPLTADGFRGDRVHVEAALALHQALDLTTSRAPLRAALAEL